MTRSLCEGAAPRDGAGRGPGAGARRRGTAPGVGLGRGPGGRGEAATGGGQKWAVTPNASVSNEDSNVPALAGTPV